MKISLMSAVAGSVVLAGAIASVTAAPPHERTIRCASA
jgi:peptidyl-Lys metalloendopeptidase